MKNLKIIKNLISIALLLVMVAIMPMITKADEKDDKIADLEARVEKLESLYEELEERIIRLEEENPEEDKSNEPVLNDNNDNEESSSDQSFYIVNQSGSSKDGITPIIYTNGDSRNMISMNIGYNQFDGRLLTYIYVDNVLVKTSQISNGQTYVMLTGDQLTEGTHTITLIQYVDNDEEGKIIFGGSEEYEVIIG